MKLRVKFSKTGHMKFIGHLDLMRFFQKAIRRSKIDIKYSEGFSPHQIMSFAAPLGLGIESFGEYMDIELVGDEISDSELKNIENSLNLCMCEGLEILKVIALSSNGKSKNAMSLVGQADYYLISDIELSKLKEAIESFNSLENIIVEKKSKDTVKEVDIKPMIVSVAASEFEGRSAVYMRVLQGSENNLKPELVADAIKKYVLEDLSVKRIIRTEIYDKEGRSLGDYGR